MTEKKRDREQPTMTSSSQYVPETLREERLWILWNLDQKIPIAPWKTGHLWWAKWNRNLPADERPEIEYDEARRYADIGVDNLLDDYWIPQHETPHDRLEPTIY